MAPAHRSEFQALCCTCGQIRTARSVRRAGHRKEPDLLEAAAGAPRCVTNLRCAVCRQITAHAYLRPDAQRDYIESAPHRSYIEATLADLELLFDQFWREAARPRDEPIDDL